MHDVLAWGLTFDLTISIPLLYWFFVVRRGKARALTLAPVFAGGSIVAAAILPVSQQQFLRQLVPLAELFFLGALVRRIALARHARSTSSDPYERIAAAARAITGEERVAAVIASEVTIFYYAFLGWRLKPVTRGITFHERNSWGTLLACIYVLIAAEGIAMHFLLRMWHPYAAWAWTLLDVWAAIWLLGDYHALRLRHTLLDDDALHLRYGLRWSATIPRDLIESIEEVREESQWKRKDVLKVAMLDDPRWLITLREPVVVHGLAGVRKRVTAIAMLPDQDLLSVVGSQLSVMSGLKAQTTDNR